MDVCIVCGYVYSVQCTNPLTLLCLFPFLFLFPRTIPGCYFLYFRYFHPKGKKAYTSKSSEGKEGKEGEEEEKLYISIHGEIDTRSRLNEASFLISPFAKITDIVVLSFYISWQLRIDTNIVRSFFFSSSSSASPPPPTTTITFTHTPSSAQYCTVKWNETKGQTERKKERKGEKKKRRKRYK